MTREQLVDIWRDYINQLAVLLVELERGDNATAADTIKQYVEEVVRSMGAHIASMIAEQVAPLSLSTSTAYLYS